MPSPFFAESFAAIKACPAQTLLLSVALVSSGLLLAGCGGSNPTTRVSSDESVSSPNSATLKFTLQSPVRLTNVQARVIDSATNRVLHDQLISTGDQLTIDIKRVDVNAGQLLYIELRPAALGQSSYYDPILDGDAAFNQPLRALVQSNGNTQTVIVDPYSEIAFQRAQIRSGWLANRSDASQIGLIKRDALAAANSEVTAVFSLNNTRNSILREGINSRSDLQKLTISTNQSNALNYFRFSLGHIQHYVRQQGSNPTPYLVFSQKAAIDMLDGDLDGMTLHGFGDQASVFVSNPLVQPIINADPERNLHLLLAADQLPARSSYNLAVGEAIKQLFKPLLISGSAEFNLINNYDYLNMTVLPSPTTPRLFGLHSPGAGNYTRAFGMAGQQTVKNFLNADDTGLVSDIEQLAGIYQNPQGCRLEIQPNGHVVLSQGTQRFEADIDRNFNDSVSRSGVSRQDYLINITTPSDSMPSFLQIRTNGADILSAQNGRSLLDLPDQLSQVDLSCDF